VVLEFELKALWFSKQLLYHLSHASNPFFAQVFEIEVSWTVCLGLASNHNPDRISASQVARITGVSHWSLA
jgi:hypothetical protein